MLLVRCRLHVLAVQSAHLEGRGTNNSCFKGVFVFSVFCPRRGAEWTPKVSPGTTFRTPKYRPNLASGGPIDGKSPSWKIRVFCNLPFISPVIIVFADVKALRFAVIPSPHPPPNLREHKSPALYRNSVSVISLDCLESPPTRPLFSLRARVATSPCPYPSALHFPLRWESSPPLVALQPSFCRFGPGFIAVVIKDSQDFRDNEKEGEKQESNTAQ